MKRFVWMTGLVAAALACFVSVSAWADVLEVKGRGMISGKILSEEGGKVLFRDSWGKILTFDKREILFMQDDTGGSKRSGNSRKTAKNFSLESITGLFVGASTIEDIHDIANGVFFEALDYLTGDAQETLSIFRSGAKNVLTTSSKKFTAQNYAGGGGGIALLGIGLIAFAAFTFMLIFNAFEQGFYWGIVLLADALIFLAPVFGGALGLVLVLPYFLSVYFVIRFWEDTRLPFAGQLFSLNIITLGYIILRGAFSWS